MISDRNGPFSHFNRHNQYLNDFNQRHELNFNASRKRFDDEVNPSKQKNNSLTTKIFKGIFVIAAVAISVITVLAISLEINRLHGLIGKDITYTKYFRTFFGIVAQRYTETFTVGKYFASLAALSLVGCMVVGIGAMMITMVLQT
ncbi:MAG: hypothetical protein H0W50_11890 [Parachlamydiaceae bacterium]|nr:hypothetical protein [Parachlamydiaceae bacterium]